MAFALAILTAFLLGLFAYRCFSNARAAALCVVLFGTMPFVWQGVRDGAPQLVLLPFVAAWMLMLATAVVDPRRRWLWLASAAAAAMLYIHLIGVVMAPVYLAIGIAALLVRRDRVPAIAVFTAGFVVIALGWVIAVLRNPALLVDAVTAYGLYDAHRFNPLQGLREMSSWVGLTVRSEVYWDCFNPAVLFLGQGDLWSTLSGSQVFLLPFAIPLAIGLAGYFRHPQQSSDWIVLAALFAAPVAAALLAQPPVPGRLLLMAPPAALIATRAFYRRAAESPPPARR